MCVCIIYIQLCSKVPIYILANTTAYIYLCQLKVTISNLCTLNPIHDALPPSEKKKKKRPGWEKMALELALLPCFPLLHPLYPVCPHRAPRLKAGNQILLNILSSKANVSTLLSHCNFKWKVWFLLKYLIYVQHIPTTFLSKELFFIVLRKFNEANSFCNLNKYKKTNLLFH